jgi:hypothetical protein
MFYLAIKAALSGILAASVSEIAKRSPAFGALVASLPLISIMAVIWLWRDTGDNPRIASHMEATFWYVLPSLPMFLVMPAMLRSGVGFWPSLAASCVLTVVLYLITAWTLAKFGSPTCASFQPLAAASTAAECPCRSMLPRSSGC